MAFSSALTVLWGMLATDRILSSERDPAADSSYVIQTLVEITSRSPGLDQSNNLWVSAAWSGPTDLALAPSLFCYSHEPDPRCLPLMSPFWFLLLITVFIDQFWRQCSGPREQYHYRATTPSDLQWYDLAIAWCSTSEVCSGSRAFSWTLGPAPPGFLCKAWKAGRALWGSFWDSLARSCSVYDTAASHR